MSQCVSPGAPNQTLRWQAWAWIALFYVAAAVLFTWPAAVLGGGGVVGYNWTEEGSFLWDFWMVRQWMWAGQPLWHHHMGFGPWGMYQFLHTHCFAPALLGALLAPVLSEAAAFNLVFVGAFAVGGGTAFALARELGLGRAGCLATGLVFSFSAHRLTQSVGHPNLIWVELLPLAVLLVWRLLQFSGDHPPWRLLLALVGAFVYSLYADYYPGIFFFLAALYTAGLALVSRTSNWRSWLRPGWLLALLGAFVALGIVLLPILWSWLVLYTQWRQPPSSDTYPFFPGVQLKSVLIPSARQLLGRLLPEVAALRVHDMEGEGYLGWAAVVAVLMAFVPWDMPRPLRRVRWAALIGFLLTFSLAMGRALNPGGQEINVPWAYRLVDSLPLFSNLRVPGRFMMLAALPWGVLAGLGVDHAARLLWRAGNRGRRVTLAAGLVALGALFVLDTFQGFPVSRLESSRDFPPALLERIRQSPATGMVVTVPLDGDSSDASLHQMFHHRPSYLLFSARQDQYAMSRLVSRDLGLPRGEFGRYDTAVPFVPPYERNFPIERFQNLADVFDMRWFLIPPHADQEAILAYLDSAFDFRWVERQEGAAPGWTAVEIDRPLPESLLLARAGWRHAPADKFASHLEGGHLQGRDAYFQFYAPRSTSAVLEVHASGLPPTIKKGRLQRMRVRLNGERVPGSERKIREEMTEYRIEIPTGAIRPGWNELQLRFSRRITPADAVPGSTDDRLLPMYLRELRLDFESP